MKKLSQLIDDWSQQELPLSALACPPLLAIKYALPGHGSLTQRMQFKFRMGKEFGAAKKLLARLYF